VRRCLAWLEARPHGFDAVPLAEAHRGLAEAIDAVSALYATQPSLMTAGAFDDASLLIAGEGVYFTGFDRAVYDLALQDIAAMVEYEAASQLLKTDDLEARVEQAMSSAFVRGYAELASLCGEVLASLPELLRARYWTAKVHGWQRSARHDRDGVMTPARDDPAEVPRIEPGDW
jgi:Ser/Thr protein kinase RdoA (MazF antagonist)